MENHEECLKLYFSESSIGPEEEWRCPHCDKKSECMMCQSIDHIKLPNVFIIHLSRFRYSKVGITKNNAKVICKDELNLNVIGINAEYNLIGIISHHGSMDMGHYVSATRIPGDTQFILCDDNFIEQIPTYEVLLLQPYILFYQRK